MSLSYELDDTIVLDSAQVLASAAAIQDPTIFQLRDHKTYTDGKRQIAEAEFIYDGDPAPGHETVLFVKRVYSPHLNDGDGSTYNELRLIYHIQQTDSVSGVVKYLKQQAGSNWTVYGDGSLCPMADAEVRNTLLSLFQHYNGSAWVWTANPIYKMSKELVDIFTNVRTTLVT